eukprot:412853_1
MHSSVMTTQSSITLHGDMDMDMDFHTYTNECDQPSNNRYLVNGCTDIAVKRLVMTLIYYTQLDIQSSKRHQRIFIAFINDIYKDCLVDYAHLVQKHKHSEAINEALKEKKLFGMCDVIKCPFASRHQSRHTIKTNVSKLTIDAVVHFYSQLMCCLHLYSVHLFEYGSRMAGSNGTDTNNENQEDENGYCDKTFARVSRIINEQQHNTFKIQTATEGSGTVYLDEVVRYLLLSSKRDKESAIRKVGKFLVSEQYDSDSIKADVKHDVEGNIALHMDDKEAFEAFARFVKGTELYNSTTVKVKSDMGTKNAKALKTCNAVDKWHIIIKYGTKHGEDLLIWSDLSGLYGFYGFKLDGYQIETATKYKIETTKYWWMAKSLREMIELYGDEYLSGFPCGWLSDLKEEDEVLWNLGVMEHWGIEFETISGRILQRSYASKS